MCKIIEFKYFKKIIIIHIYHSTNWNVIDIFKKRKIMHIDYDIIGIKREKKKIKKYICIKW